MIEPGRNGRIMKSDIITVGNDERFIESALEMCGQYVYQSGVDGKKATHINLLAEEVLCMARSMVGDFSARFWIEDEAGEYRIHLDAIADVDRDKKKELMSLSKSGKNIANKGLLAKIGGFFSDCMDNYDEAMALSSAADNYGYSFAAGVPASSMMTLGASELWSLSRYRSGVESEKEDKKEAKEAWDELEKSVIANIADDVIVGVKDNHVTLIVVKK